MFWSKKGDRKVIAPQANPSIPAVAGDAALDATGAIVRILGKHAFDLDHLSARTISEQCEQWARHILIAAPYPGAEPSDIEHSSEAARNWQGLRDFITQLRRREHTFVTSNFKDMRQVLGDFIDTLGKVIVENEDDQAKIADRLNYLRNVIESNASLDSIKREAMQVVGAIGRIVEVRQQTQRSLLDNLTNRLKSMREELSAARQEMELDALTRLYNRSAFDQDRKSVV